jgi:hypothetical protein
MPELKKLNDIDVKILLLHCMGMSSGSIAQNTCMKKEFIESIIERHDPRGVMSLNEGAKHAVIKMQLTNAIGILTGTLWNLDEIQKLPYIERVKAVKELITAMQMVKVVLPKNTDATSAMERLKSNGIGNDERTGDRGAGALPSAEADVAERRQRGDVGSGDSEVQRRDVCGDSIESLASDAQGVLAG